HFLAGLSSGLTSAVLLQPADLLKTRLQQHGTVTTHLTLRGTIHSLLSSPHPIKALWRGTLPSALRTGFGSALYFSTLNALRHHAALLRPTSPTPSNPTHPPNPTATSSSLPKLSALANLTTGGLARAFAGLVTMPITVLKVRFESSLYTYPSLPSAFMTILRAEGPRGFFAGFGATAVRDAPFAGLYVLFYELSKRELSAVFSRGTTHTTHHVPVPLDAPSPPGGVQNVNANGNPELSPKAAAGINFTSGVAAAGLATLLTNPFDAIKTRLQLMPQRYGNTVQAARMMLREEGLRSVFDGLGLRMARKAVSSALAWMLYEELIRRAEGRLGGV
ncbi:putative mitochondrial carrier protein, partial [Patellaria atrata CBS 101060]